MSAIGTNIDYTTRKIVSWEPDGREATKSVTLNTGEVMVDGSTHDIQAHKSVTFTESGTAGPYEIEPDEGYEGIAQVEVGIYIKPFYAYKNESNYIYTREIPTEAGPVTIVTVPLDYASGTFVEETEESYIEYSNVKYYRDESKDFEM